MRYKVTLQQGAARVTEEVDIEDTGHPVQNNIRAIEAARNKNAAQYHDWEPSRVQAVAS